MSKPITARMIAGKFRHNRYKLPHCRVQATNVDDFWVWISGGPNTGERLAPVRDFLLQKFPGYTVESYNDGLIMRKRRESRAP